MNLLKRCCLHENEQLNTNLIIFHYLTLQVGVKYFYCTTMTCSFKRTLMRPRLLLKLNKRNRINAIYLVQNESFCKKCATLNCTFDIIDILK